MEGGVGGVEGEDLNKPGPLLSMEDERTIRFHLKHLNLYSEVEQNN